MVDCPITIQVVYAESGRQMVRRVEVAAGTTVMQAINASGIAVMLPHETIDIDRLGIFSHKVPPGHLVQDGDRIEIYRPLMLDPMEARRRRAR